MELISNLHKKLFGIAGAIVIIIFLTQIFTLYIDLYSIISWFDNLMHFMGGVFLAYFLSAFAAKYTPSVLRKEKRFILTLVLVIFLIGFVWELYEYVVDVFITQFGPNYVDIATDLLFDMLGGTLTTYLIWETELKNRFKIE